MILIAEHEQMLLARLSRSVSNSAGVSLGNAFNRTASEQPGGSKSGWRTNMTRQQEIEHNDLTREYERIASDYRAGRINNAQLLAAQAQTQHERDEIDRE